MNDDIRPYGQRYRLALNDNHLQPCPVCTTQMGDMPGSRDAYCPNYGFKDPCCE